MSLKYIEKGETVIVYIESYLDLGNSPVIQKDLNLLIEKFPDRDFVLNMKGVAFMNSAGLGVLILLSKKLESFKRSLRLTNLNSSLLNVIRLLEADEIISIYDDEEKALESLITA